MGHWGRLYAQLTAGTSGDKAPLTIVRRHAHCVSRARAAASRCARSVDCRGTAQCVRAAEGSEQSPTPARMRTLGPPGLALPLYVLTQRNLRSLLQLHIFPGGLRVNWLLESTGDATLHVEPVRRMTGDGWSGAEAADAQHGGDDRRWAGASPVDRTDITHSYTPYGEAEREQHGGSVR